MSRGLGDVYKRQDKEVGIKKVFMPTGDVEKDMRMIKSYYKSFHARRPENFVTGL